jgi:hypothetical protein
MRKAGQRVYMLLVRDNPPDEKKRFGTVDHDEIEGWDYTDVCFDDFPALVQPIVSWYLYDLEGEGESK